MTLETEHKMHFGKNDCTLFFFLKIVGLSDTDCNDIRLHVISAPGKSVFYSFEILEFLLVQSSK